MGLLKKITLGTAAVVIISTGMSMYHANKWQNSKSPQLEKLIQIEYIFDSKKHQLETEKMFKNITDPINAQKYNELSKQCSDLQEHYNKLINIEGLKERKISYDYHMNRFAIYHGTTLVGLLVLLGCLLASDVKSNSSNSKLDKEYKEL